MSENYENMSNEEIKEQLEWSDHHEFSYNYAIWAFEEINRLNNIINELEEIINYEIQEWKDTDDELMKARVQEDKHILEVIEELKEK